MEEKAASTETTAATAPTSPPAARSIGERLRAGRERSGLSIPAAAEKLHLDPKVIEALEADRFAEIGASVYVRGHLKRYADFVGEPGAELVSMYSAREARITAPDLTQVPQPERRTDPRRMVAPLVVLGCSAVLLGAIWWVLAGSRTGSSAVPKAQASPVVTEDAGPMAAPAPAMATPASLTTAAVAVPVPAAPAPAQAGNAAAVIPAATTKEAPAREIRLRLELTNESWVEVYDSSGKQQFYDIASAGSVQSISGPGPLRVFLGNPAGVSVQVDGQSREIPSAAVDGEGARFVVNRSGSLSKSAR
ncbi:MAG TPA: RodZ domain-containing protein [Steroidobacteraceae bacterium]|nr:RodZ domain-containing protein [Steroidobacteraceae bacterium]